MKRTALLVLASGLLLALALAGCGSATTASQPANRQPQAGPRPPIAERRPYVVKSPAGDREDPYYWLRDDTRNPPDVCCDLSATDENHREILDPVKPLENKLLAELKSHVQEDDTTTPVFDDG